VHGRRRRRPYIGVLVTLDPDAIGPWKERNGKPADATIADLRTDPDLLAEIQAAVDGREQGGVPGGGPFAGSASWIATSPKTTGTSARS